MTLGELRKLTIKKQLKIHFTLKNSLECIIDEHGLALVPDLRKTPDFNLDLELAEASVFLVDFVKEVDKKGVAKRQRFTSAELAALTKAGPAGAAADHDDD